MHINLHVMCLHAKVTQLPKAFSPDGDKRAHAAKTSSCVILCCFSFSFCARSCRSNNQKRALAVVPPLAIEAPTHIRHSRGGHFQLLYCNSNIRIECPCPCPGRFHEGPHSSLSFACCAMPNQGLPCHATGRSARKMAAAEQRVVILHTGQQECSTSTLQSFTLPDARGGVCSILLAAKDLLLLLEQIMTCHRLSQQAAHKHTRWQAGNRAAWRSFSISKHSSLLGLWQTNCWQVRVHTRTSLPQLHVKKVATLDSQESHAHPCCACVCADGGLHIGTPVDVLFLMLPVLEKARNKVGRRAVQLHCA